MPERDLETLFLAFRERGDVAALSAAFDHTSDELLTLALHLVPEPAQAEDIVQATFLTAIERAESFDRTRAFIPWLVGILARHAASARRERARTPDVARIETRVEPDPSDEMERAEVTCILERAIEQLPEPYRAAVKRHVIDGERAVDIARQSGIAAGTVRMHILRGLERLRRALPAGLLGAGAWNVRGTDALRSSVLHAARSKARILASGATASTATGISATVWTIGGLLVTTKILLGVGALVVAALFLWNLAPAHAPASMPAVVSSPTRTARASGSMLTPTSELDRVRHAAVDAPPSATGTQADAAGWWLSGDVSGLDDKAGEETKLTVRCIPGDVVTGSCDHAGHFELDVGALFAKQAPVELLVSATHPANRAGSAIVPLAPELAEQGRIARADIHARVQLVPFAKITGRIVTPGRSGDDAIVRLCPSGMPGPGYSQSPEHHDHGCFEFQVARAGGCLLRAGAEGLLPEQRSAVAVLGETTDVGPIELARGDIAIDGVLHLPFERGHARWTIVARRPGTNASRSSVGESDAQVSGLEQVALCDMQGRFHMTGLTPGAWQLELAAPYVDGLRIVWQTPVDCVAPASGVVVGDELGRIVVDVESDGRSCKGAEVSIAGTDLSSVTTSADRPTAFLTDMGRDVELIVKASGFDEVRNTVPATARLPDMVQRIELPSTPKSSTLVLEPVGSSPARVVLQLRSPESKPARPAPTNRAVLNGGKYTFPGVMPGHWLADITPTSAAWHGTGGGEFLCSQTLEIDLADGQTLVQPVKFDAAGRVRFEIKGWTDATAGVESGARARILDAQDHDVGAVFVQRTYAGERITLSSTKGWIALDMDSELAQGLRPDVYHLVLTSDTWRTDPVSFRVEPGLLTTVRVALQAR